MTRLVVEAPAQLQSETITMADGEPVLLGRAPDASLLDAFEGASSAHAQRRTIVAPSVSSTHAAAWIADGAVHLVDLASRNGTWVRLPARAVVRLPLGEEIQLRLADSSPPRGAETYPEAARYRDRADFGSGVATAVRAWLQHNEVPAKVWSATPKPDAGVPSGVMSVTLGNGESLFVQVERTMDVSFHERMATVCRYVNAQNALFRAEESARCDGMVLASPSIRQVHRRVIELAMQSLPAVILLGPSGTGKERLAQAYHRHLDRNGPLVAVNCATLSRDRIVADLFGAEAGAYTDAKKTMMGAVERADGGTLFLDELGELPLDVQPLLLRFLETGEYQRLGATGRPRFADVRVVTATNRDLRKMVREGAFREDLFFRLALEIVEVPALRDRPADVEAYLRNRTLGDTSAYEAIDAGGRELLRAYSWRGNFRELMNFTRRLPTPSGPDSLDLAFVRRALEAGSIVSVAPAASTVPPDDGASDDGWLEWLRASADAFNQSASGEPPSTWSDMAAFIEQFLKPWALAHLGGVADARGIDDVSIGGVADRLKADRGTVVKQLRRYFDCRSDAVDVPS